VGPLLIETRLLHVCIASLIFALSQEVVYLSHDLVRWVLLVLDGKLYCLLEDPDDVGAV